LREIYRKRGKRIFDVVGSLIALSVCSPILMLIACAIKLDSRGPVIFKQKRMGRGGNPFTIFKFRTMYYQSCGSHALVRTRNDPRVTRMGKFLRRSHLDELLQLFNVVRGEMSIVGPRPEEWSSARELSATIRGWAKCRQAMPGITGPTQVYLGREMVFELGDSPGRRAEAKFIRWYIINFCFLVDLKIIAKTSWHCLQRQGV